MSLIGDLTYFLRIALQSPSTIRLVAITAARIGRRVGKLRNSGNSPASGMMINSTNAEAAANITNFLANLMNDITPINVIRTPTISIV